MATRLDRLWVLLDSGSTAVTRKAAAEQIGEVQKLHPHELHNLLRKVSVYLSSKSWETRVAAGQAVAAIARNVKKWQPKREEEDGRGKEGKESPPADLNADLLSFETFDVNQVLSQGTPLLSSTGEEFRTLENDPEYQKMTPQERASFHRQQLRQRLGLVAQGKVFSTGIEGLFEDSDLVVTMTTTEGEGRERNSGRQDKPPELSALQLRGLSAREKNRAKRKARQMARRNSRDGDSAEKSEGEPPSKKPKTTSVVVEQAGQSDKLLIDQIADADSVFDESEEWPFVWFCDEMFRNLFNAAWEVRHGAATALREVVRLHGETAGISVSTPPEKHVSENQRWLVDAAIRFLCVFALDRFADFISDQVVAPVRATCAQALGMVVRPMSAPLVHQTVGLLLSLAGQDQWEVRHASLMGMQHLLAARTDLSPSLLPRLCSTILRGLQDVDDDVRAVAASALLPVATSLHIILPDKMRELLQILWDSLLELDDLSPSTASIMELLCILLSCGSTTNHPTTAGPPCETGHSSNTGPTGPSSITGDSGHSTTAHPSPVAPQPGTQVQPMIVQPPENSATQSQAPQLPLSSQATGDGTQTAGAGESVLAPQCSSAVMHGPDSGAPASDSAIVTTIHSQTYPHSAAAAVNIVTAQMQPLEILVPRLWPFLSHTIASVRSSCLKVLQTILRTTQSAATAVTVTEDRDDEPMQSDAGPRLASSGSTSREWLRSILQSVLCQLFQRFALEGDEGNRDLVHQVWEAVLQYSATGDLALQSAPLFMPWLCLLVCPSSVPIESSLLVPPSPGAQVRSNLFLGGCLEVETVATKEQAAIAARVTGAKALGLLASKVVPAPPTLSASTPAPAQSQEPLPPLHDGLKQLLSGNSAVHKMLAALVVGFWGQCPSDLLPLLNTALTEQTVYEEVTPFVIALQKDCHALIMAFDRKGMNVAQAVTPSGYTTEFAAQLATKTYESAVQSGKLSTAEKQELDGLRRSVLTSLGQLQEEQQRVGTRVHCCVSGALATLGCLPPKLNPIIRPLMDCVKAEDDALVQSLSAQWLSRLLGLCKDRSPSPNSKIVKNLASFACCDPKYTPSIRPDTTPESDSQASKAAQTPSTPTEEPSKVEAWEWNIGIITLVRLQKQSTTTRILHSRGRPSAAVREAMAAAAEEQQHKPVICQRRGAESTLTAVARHFGSELFTALPQLWTLISEPLQNLPSTDGHTVTEELLSAAQSVIHSLQVLETVAPAVDSSLRPRLLSLLPRLLSALCSSFTAVRHMAARCITVSAQVDLHHTMQFLISDVVPYLGDTTSVAHRQGAIETIVCLLESVGLEALCYVVLLVMPVLGRMSDQQEDVRLMASRCFASLVTLMPLESGVESPPEMPLPLAEQREKERCFLEQLLDTSKLESYSVPVPIKADLRKYQQDGINWLAFLNKYKLHGILCDDMGLGKTLQSLCIVAGDHHYRVKEFKETGHSDRTPLPSLVVCPPTLIGHWYYEVEKFCSSEDLTPLQYSGPPNTRARLQTLVPKHNLIIASYDIVRNDIEFFRSITWNYCILDEGHIIKNTKTKITKAVKQLRANHRLILTGTPIQNNVLELWSLFDFLMTGFLGTERQFYERFGKPILLSRDAKSSSKEQEAGALAMESLHRQVLPFLLRRMKEDVLQDLPPKIIQDYYCELSPLQSQLYEDFAKSRAKQEVQDSLVQESKGEAQRTTHIFQALQYLRKVCNHPALVVGPEHPLYLKVKEHLQRTSSTLRDIRHAAKLQALKQLLHDCGIGASGEGEGVSVSLAISQHRALLFCQYKSMLDIIEKDLLKVHMPSVTYLRLDGSVSPSNRYGIVQKFNSDPSVDVLLLTTHVGGLGLNLTGADTVIFFEHDWNPMKDLQAMDRAHRIGQKKVVNVYRLITKGTLEEKIMSLQKFKLNIANTVITQENSSLQSMNTSELLDLFRLSDAGASRANETAAKPVKGGKETQKGVIENLSELWDEEQYKSEYDFGGFMQSLASAK